MTRPPRTLTASDYAAARMAELCADLDDPAALSELRRLAACWPDEAKVLPPAFRARLGMAEAMEVMS